MFHVAFFDCNEVGSYGKRCGFCKPNVEPNPAELGNFCNLVTSYKEF